MNMKYISFDTVDTITVPQEAIDKAQDISSLTDSAGSADTEVEETETSK